jgi:hypothetical protein
MNDTTRPSHRRHDERGSALMGVFVIVIVCGALALSVLLPNLARHREAKAAVERERAFQLAEAGIDFGIAEMRKSGGILPTTPTETGTPGNGTSGSFTLTYTAGNANGVDDDGDGIDDDADEAEMVQLVSTGRFNDTERTIRMMMRRSVSVPTIAASIQFNVEFPIIDVNGNSFFVSGFEHDLLGTKDTSLTPSHGLAAPTDPVNLEVQIPSNRTDQIEGAGGTPSITYVDAIDLDTLVEQAKSAATHSLSASSAYSQLSLGAPTPGGVVVAVCEGDLHLSGVAEGFGILVVDGDMKCSGELLWTGIILIRGRAIMTGGGTTKRLIGAMIVGEEVIGGIDDTQTVKLGGTVDMLYSSEAIELAQQRLAMMTVLSWQEVASP